MRKLLLFLTAALALVVTGVSQPASLATKSVKITASAFSPANVTINTGDTVTWTNADTKSHQVIANNGSFASTTLAANKKYSHVFNTAGTFNYHDALHPSLKGKIVVKGSPPAVTIGAAQPILTFGQATHVGGAVSSKQAGQTVTVWAQPYGQVSAVLVATLLTGANGAWDLPVQPTTLTSYQARWKSSVSATIQVAMRPAMRFSANRRVGFIRLSADRSLAGRKVYVQRLTRFGEWVKIRRIILGSGSKKRFFLHLKKGNYFLRVVISTNEAGAGYQEAFSNTVHIRKR
ncbi:MAG TPA: cupredoxin domain-containing protein [Gaiellaceae bacterium]|nr:cupredoxin domain-containing protein [Gaiellaceae bacterium]